VGIRAGAVSDTRAVGGPMEGEDAEAAVVASATGLHTKTLHLEGHLVSGAARFPDPPGHEGPATAGIASLTFSLRGVGATVPRSMLRGAPAGDFPPFPRA